MKLCLPLHEDNLKPARDFIEQWVATFDVKRLSTFTLVASEVITNLLKHAEHRASEIEVDLTVSGNRWTMNIRDDGSAFHDFTQKIEHADNTFDELMTSGMGLGLIKELVDEYHYFPDDMGKNCYRFVIEVEPEITIALIDDDPSILVLLEAYLEDHFSVKSYSNGVDALQGFKKRSIDLIISDINMPDLNGLQLRQSVQPILGAVPFIFLTGENIEDVHRLAIDDVLHKPVTKQALLASIDRVLVRHKELISTISKQLAPSISRQLAPSIESCPKGFKVLLGTRFAHGGGGDFIFQSHEEGEGNLLLLGDVMGHDQQAKFFVHAYQGYLQGVCHALKGTTDPGALLTALSQGILKSELLGSSLLTAIALYLADNGQNLLACAGHPAPLQLRDGLWQEVDVSGALLGFVEEEQYTSQVIDMSAPTLLYTDGLFESITSAEREELLKVLAIEIDQPNASLDRVLDYYDSKAGLPVPDDVTVLVLIPD